LNGILSQYKRIIKKRGKTIGLVECSLFDEKGSLVAFSTSTSMVLAGEKASGRSNHVASESYPGEQQYS